MALIGYARVSTREQDLSSQMAALESAGCDEIFSGKHSGDSNQNEVKLDEMLKYIRKGDTVLVTKLERLGRSLKSILNMIDQIHSKNATLKSLDGAIDTSNNTPFAKAQIALLGTFAQLERDLIVYRTSEGRERAKAAGKRFGRPPILTDEQIEEGTRLLESGESINKLSKKLGVSRMTVSRNIWTLEACKRAAFACSTRGAWKKGNPSAYQAARRRGWLEECCAHMNPKNEDGS